MNDMIDQQIQMDKKSYNDNTPSKYYHIILLRKSWYIFYSRLMHKLLF